MTDRLFWKRYCYKIFAMVLKQLDLRLSSGNSTSNNEWQSDEIILTSGLVTRNLYCTKPLSVKFFGVRTLSAVNWNSMKHES
nr:ORF29 [Bracoviriform inaniti]